MAVDRLFEALSERTTLKLELLYEAKDGNVPRKHNIKNRDGGAGAFLTSRDLFFF